jgi:uncharacterized phage protein (TIGR01671 family)
VKEMREILFKAKTRDCEKKWVEGYVFKSSSNFDNYIIYNADNDESCLVDINTLCQYTGLTDKNGNKIWENDILSIKQVMDGLGTYYHPPIFYPANVLVKWDLCSWMWEVIGKDKYYIHFPNAWCHYESEVIGNIFDNPEMLGGADNG